MKVKMKTHKGIKSRFKVTKSGKLMRRRKGRRHILTKKSGGKKRALARPVSLDETVVKKYARLMGAGR